MNAARATKSANGLVVAPFGAGPGAPRRCCTYGGGGLLFPAAGGVLRHPALPGGDGSPCRPVFFCLTHHTHSPLNPNATHHRNVADERGGVSEIQTARFSKGATMERSEFHLRIKAAMRDLIQRSGGLKRACDVTGLSAGHLSRFSSLNYPDLPNVEVAVLLERDVGQPLVTAIMAEWMGLSLSEADVSAGKAGPGLADTTARVMREAADLSGQVMHALGDGRLTPNEAVVLDRNASSLEAAAADLRRVLAGAQITSLNVIAGGR